MELLLLPLIVTLGLAKKAFGDEWQLGLLAMYFLPTLVALSRNHHQKSAIFVLDLFAGWTFIGWVVAIVWASTRVHRIHQPRPVAPWWREAPRPVMDMRKLAPAPAMTISADMQAIPEWHGVRPAIRDFFKESVALIAIIVGAVAIITLGAIAISHAGEQTRFYDNRGRATGTATTDSQGTTVFRDDRGNVTGRAYRSGR
jgi:hypothetical protein